MAECVVGDIELDFKSFPRKSGVQVGAVDVTGRSVLHHLVSPLKCGSYENIWLLKILVEAGGSLQQADKSGKTPLQLALDLGLTTMAKAIQKLLGKPTKSWVSFCCCNGCHIMSSIRVMILIKIYCFFAQV